MRQVQDQMSLFGWVVSNDISNKNYCMLMTSKIYLWKTLIKHVSVFREEATILTEYHKDWEYSK